MPIVRQMTRGDFDHEPGPELDHARLFLAAGDSWFSIGSIEFENLLWHLDLPYEAVAVNVAYHGSTLARIADWMQNPDLLPLLLNRGGRPWHAILLSVGGNDLIDAVWDTGTRRSALLRRPADPAAVGPADLPGLIDADAWNRFSGYLVHNLTRVVTEGRDAPGSASRGLPLFLHTYARTMPRDAPARFGPLRLGPWLHPAVRWLGIDPALGLPMADLLLGRLADTLRSVAPLLPNVHLIDTLADAGGLQPAAAGTTGASNGWDNEIHPGAAGYAQLAGVWSREIQRVAP